MKQEIRIVIADDHPLMRQGLRQVIEIEPNLKVVGEAGNGSEALAMIEQLRPDVAILDVDMPHQDGFQVAKELAAKTNPASIIFLTIHSEEQMFHAALDLGAKGYVLKDSAIDDIVNAIKEVMAGRAFTSLPMTTYFTRRQNYNAVPEKQQLGLGQLTVTESRIMALLADYKTSKEIAEILSVSPHGRNSPPPNLPETKPARFARLNEICGPVQIASLADRYVTELLIYPPGIYSSSIAEK